MRILRLLVVLLCLCAPLAAATVEGSFGATLTGQIDERYVSLKFEDAKTSLSLVLTHQQWADLVKAVPEKDKDVDRQGKSVKKLLQLPLNRRGELKLLAGKKGLVLVMKRGRGRESSFHFLADGAQKFTAAVEAERQK